MTTIVWDGTTLAADSQTTQCNRRASVSAQKIFEKPADETWSLLSQEVLAMGVAGDSGAIAVLRHHLRVGLVFESEIPQPLMFQALVITADRDCYLLTKEAESPYVEFIQIYEADAIGSGADFALAAIKCGKDAAGAVELAKTFDIYTGGTTVSWRMPDQYPDEIPF